MLRLYDTELSGNCYKVRLLIALLGLECERVTIDLPAGESHTAEFLGLNPRGQVPVLADGETVIWDSQAILTYLARRYAGPEWLPLEPAPLARIMQWLALSENECLFGLARARAVRLFGRPWDLAESQAYARHGLGVLEGHLDGREWLATAHPTIADVACYPYVALAPEGGIGLEDHPAVRAWLARVAALPGYVAMPGIG